ncbi:MAG: cytochrome c biosis protein CcmG, thiol:disulfide interchange protein DsbE [Solirubrobacteraceae bacterium]|jgi:cytochrome c biogenesis protein CcmG/thiol:disulfide interchange protein DsbE|nr:cytochrome c biosis protein CcmG, thiol:disulfide interchange protein DsbE [Solirubrobacteraceae bacterium]
MRLLRVAVLAAVAAAALAVALQNRSTPPRPAPPLPGRTLHPPGVTLAALRGRPVLVNFWASWCHPCRGEAPQLAAFARSAAGRGHLIGVDTGDDPAAARRFIARYAWSFPVLGDPQSTTAVDYRVPGLPTTYAVDAGGRIVAQLLGAQTAGSLTRALRAASG